MIDSIIGYLRESLINSGYFTNVYGLCELIIKEDKTIPAFYKGKGEYYNINDIDKGNGTGYFRADGNPRSESTSSVYTSCDKYLDITYPLQFIGAVKKAKIPCDNAYAANIICQSVAGIISTTRLSSVYEILSSKIHVTEFSVDGSEILNREYKSAAIKEFNFNYAYFNIMFDVKITVKSDCLILTCYG